MKIWNYNILAWDNKAKKYNSLNKFQKKNHDLFFYISNHLNFNFLINPIFNVDKIIENIHIVISIIHDNTTKIILKTDYRINYNENKLYGINIILSSLLFINILNMIFLFVTILKT